MYLTGRVVFVSDHSRRFLVEQRGLPAAKARVGGIPEVAVDGQVAWYCEPGNAQDLARAMHAAAMSEERLSRGRTARDLACSGYSISRAYHAYDEVYRELLQGGKRP
jgi:glycosyltransferase involved in cell wall biosynthesis